MKIIAPHIKVGNKGECIARLYLKKIGYKIYGYNVRIHRDEIDIIAYDPLDKVIVFAEVKTRSHKDRDFGPELNMTYAKKKKLQRSARAWMQDHDCIIGYRIDVIFVVERKVVDHWKELEV